MENNENTTETPVTDETSTLSSLKNRIRKLPLKKIAIAAALTTVAVLVISNKDKLTTDQKYFKMTDVELLPDGTILVGNLEPIDAPIID